MAISAACAACSPAPVKKLTLHDQRQQVLDQIADRCGVLRATFHLVGDEELTMRPDPNEDYEDLDCALKAVTESKIPFKLGFVGNEAYSTGNSAGGVE